VAAPKGNKYWESRRTHGNHRVFDTPQDLWSAAVDYFIYIEENPLQAADLVKHQGEAKVAFVPKMRAMTEEDFCIQTKMSQSTWTNYCTGEGTYKDFLAISLEIKSIIRTQKFQGAAADLLNGSIIARDLGLVDKQEVNNKLVVSRTKKRFDGEL